MKARRSEILLGAVTGLGIGLALSVALGLYAGGLALALGLEFSLSTVLGTVTGLVRAALGGPVTIPVGGGLSGAEFTMAGPSIGLIFITVLTVAAFAPSKALQRVAYNVAFFLTLVVIAIVSDSGSPWGASSAAIAIASVTASAAGVQMWLQWHSRTQITRLLTGGIIAFGSIWLAATVISVSTALAPTSSTDRLLIVLLIPLLAPTLGLVGVQVGFGQEVSASASAVSLTGQQGFQGDVLGALSVIADLPSWSLAAACLLMACMITCWRSFMYLASQPANSAAASSGVVTTIAIVVSALALLTFPLSNLSIAIIWPQATDAVNVRSASVALLDGASPFVTLMTGLLVGLLALVIVNGVMGVRRRISSRRKLRAQPAMNPITVRGSELAERVTPP